MRRVDRGIYERRPGVLLVKVTRRINGVEKNLYQTVNTGIREARRVRAEMESQFDQRIDLKTQRLVGATLDDLMDEYFRFKAKQVETNDFSITTLEEYRRLYRTCVGPALGHIRLVELSAHHLDTYYYSLVVSANSIRQRHSLISGALKQATKWGMVADNVARKASPPKAQQAEKRVPAVEDVVRFMDAAWKYDLRVGMAILWSAHTAPRRSDLIGLRWNRINFELGVCTYSTAVVWSREQRGRWIEKPNKAHYTRTIQVGPEVMESLAKFRQAMEEKCRHSEGRDLPADAFVFSSMPAGDIPWRGDYLNLVVSRLREELGIKDFHHHMLRHFTGSNLAALGVPDVEIQKFLGHKQLSTTQNFYIKPTGNTAIAGHLSDIYKRDG